MIESCRAGPLSYTFHYIFKGRNRCNRPGGIFILNALFLRGFFYHKLVCGMHALKVGVVSTLN